MSFLDRKTSLINFQIFRLLYCFSLICIAIPRFHYFWETRGSGVFKGVLIESIFSQFFHLEFTIYLSSFLLILSLIFNGFGLWTRVTAPLSLLFYLNAFYLTEIEFQPYDSNIVVFSLFVLCFFPYQSSWPLRVSKIETKLKSWPLELLKLNMVLVYFAAFCAKLINSGGHWVSGQTLQLYLFERAIMTGNSLAEFAANHLWICTVFSLFTLLGEGLFWFVFMPQKWLRNLAIVTGIVMHIGVFLFMDINFKLFTISYLVFVPYDKIIIKFSKYSFRQFLFFHP